MDQYTQGHAPRTGHLQQSFRLLLCLASRGMKDRERPVNRNTGIHCSRCIGLGNDKKFRRCCKKRFGRQHFQFGPQFHFGGLLLLPPLLFADLFHQQTFTITMQLRSCLVFASRHIRLFLHQVIQVKPALVKGLTDKCN